MNAASSWSVMLYTASTWVLPVIIAVTFHEAAHGFIAHRFGDDTALQAGRMTLNPLKHVDLFGTIIMPAVLILFRSPFLFGYAKPVPVNFGQLRHPRRDMIWVALAGPAMNVLLAIASSLLFYSLELIPQRQVGWFAENLVHSLQLNAVLCVFNMLPLPPLDGSRVAMGILPRPLAIQLARLEPYGMMILLALVFILPMIGRNIGADLNIVSWLITAPTQVLIHFVLLVTGQT